MAKADVAFAKKAHDNLLEEMPEGASHDTVSCPICAIDETTDAGREGRVSDAKTYTEEELQAAVDEAVTAAVSPLKEQVEKFQSAQASSELAEQIAAATAPLDAKVTELETQLDTTTARAETAEKRASEVEEWLQAETEAAKAAEELKVRKDERVAAARELVAFSDEYVDGNADRWAEMPDEAWTATLDGWREIAQAEGQGERPPTSEIPRETALQATGTTGGKSNTSAAKDVVRLRRSGVNVSTLTR